MTILNYEQLVDYQNQLSMVDGGFDPIHDGHIEYFKAAKEIGLKVICVANTDDYIRGKHRIILTQECRLKVLDSIKYIDYVTINRSTTAGMIEAIKPKFYIKGEDWRGKLPKEEVDTCQQVGCEVVYTKTVRNSSSKIVRELFNS